MRRCCSTARVLALAAAALALALSPDGVGATPETTCAAAAARDRRVDYGFCVSLLSHHHDSPDADAWGLAKVAADVGVATSGSAVYDIKALLSNKPKPPPAGGASARAALEQCRALYDAAGLAYDGINRRDYAAGKGRAADAASLAGRCGAAFARAGVTPPPQVARAGVTPPPQVARWGVEAEKIAVVCTAVTSLVG